MNHPQIDRVVFGDEDPSFRWTATPCGARGQERRAASSLRAWLGGPAVERVEQRRDDFGSPNRLLHVHADARVGQLPDLVAVGADRDD